MTRRVPLYRQAQHQLKSYIETHGLGPGDPLPPETILARELGMSRLSLREGMKSLESLGVVEVRHGNGVFVQPFSFQPILENLPYSFLVDGGPLRDLLQVREALEEGLLGMVMSRLQPCDLDALDLLINQMEARASKGESPELEDRQFHIRLFSRLENQLVLRLLELFWDVYHRLEGEVVPQDFDFDRVVSGHRAIVEALRTGDSVQAVSALTDHFSSARGRIEASGNPATAI